MNPINVTNVQEEFTLRFLRRTQGIALAVGVVAAVLTLVGAVFDVTRFFQAYLVAFMFWVTVTVGFLLLAQTYHVAGGVWGAVVSRFLEAGARTMPLLLVALIPLLFGLPVLYPWARPAAVAADPALQHKTPYLNVPFFVVRSIVFIAAWIAVAWIISGWSRRRDRGPDLRLSGRLQRLSGLGLVFVGVTASFAVMDWAMSLEPDWYSSIYAGMVIMGGVLGAFALLILLMVPLLRRYPLAGVVTPRILNDLGALLLAFVMIWAYLAFSQFLLIWAGNLTEEIPWYLRRLQGGWQYVALAVVLLHFALPFVMLILTDVKRSARALGAVAALVFVTRFVDTYWLVSPAFTPWTVHWLDLTCVVALGGLWIALFCWQLARAPLLPLHDPRLEPHLEALHEQARETA